MAVRIWFVTVRICNVAIQIWKLIDSPNLDGARPNLVATARSVSDIADFHLPSQHVQLLPQPVLLPKFRLRDQLFLSLRLALLRPV